MSVSSASTSHASASHLQRTLPLSRPSTHSHGDSTGGTGGGGGTHRLKSLSRQEARLGVTSEYRDLALHSAAANGNVCLVQYALSHGQPVNSVLNGVLPLHAAASSGSETVVRMLIEAGADVNSPRLPRRYSNERSKTSGLSVGTAGSTPLHFAAANGHTDVINLLLSYGADPRLAEKHGITPEAIALQNGHADAVAALRAWAPPPPSSSGRSGGGEDEDDVASLLSTRSSLRNLSLGIGGKGKGKKRLHAQRSFDALATRLQQHASTTSLHSLASLASIASGGGSPNPSSSQISLGAALPSFSLSPNSSSSSTTSVSRRISLPARPRRHTAAADRDASGSARRPSLPSVWEKASHPRAALVSALGMTAGKQGKGRADTGGEEAEKGRDGLEDDVEEDEEAESVEGEERRRSMEVHRPLRQDSFQRLSPTTTTESSPVSPSSAPSSHSIPPAPSTTATAAKTNPALVRAVSQHQFYRPRQSSQLSTQSFSRRRPSVDDTASAGGSPNAVLGGGGGGGAVFEDSPPPSASTSPARPRALSTPLPPPHLQQLQPCDSRSPLLQHAQLNHAVSSVRAREPSGSSTIENGTATPASSRPSTAGNGFLGDEELSSAESSSQAGGSAASRTRVPPASASSAFSAAAAAQARARSNSASTDSSLPLSSTRSGPTYSQYSYSTAPTSVAPSSPGIVARAFAPPAVEGGLAPLYESRAPPLGMRPNTGHGSDEEPPMSRAQAQRRVNEREAQLLAFKPSSSAASSSTGGKSGEGRSLKEQLAAYGRSLRVERELAEREEKQREQAGGYRFETIASAKASPAATSAAGNAASVASFASTSSSAVPAWRAIPTTDSLGPPPPTLLHPQHASRPHHSGTPSPGTPRASSAGSKTPTTVLPPGDSPARPPLPTSTRSGKSSSHHALPPALAPSVAKGPTVLGQGPGGVSFVGIQAVTHSALRAHSSAPPAASSSSSQPRTSRSDRSSSGGGGRNDGSSAASQGGAGAKVTTKEQVEQDRLAKLEAERKVPRAVRTVPDKRKGGLRRLFGGK
ncbi:hypothetical protein JCM10213_009197 [Rhodosporidiobolus nylandii]